MPIRIAEVILQRVDPSEELKLSERPLPPDTAPEIFDYFRDHISNSLRSQNLGTARFLNLDDPVADACRGLLSAEGKRVPSALAKSLGILAKRLRPLLPKRRDPRCDLAVCIYEMEAGDGISERRLALLKLDPSEGYRVEVKKDEKGLTFYTMVYETEMLPTPKNELQKCAFVRSLQPRPGDFDLSVLDKESRKSDVVASYWIHDFLGAEPVLDARRSTKNLLEALVGIENQLLVLDVDLWRNKLAPAVRTALAGETVHLTRRWIDDLGLPIESAAQVIAGLKDKEVFDRAFPLDRPILEKATQTISFKGDHELRVEVLEVHLEDVVQPPKRVVIAGEPYYEIVLRTKKWERTS